MIMKHLLPLLLLISFTVYTQDIAVLKHTNYTSHYSKSKHYPVLVEWTITKAMVGCPTPLKRKDNFKPDPQLPSETNLLNDYVKSGFDRGHLMPAADNLCQTPQVQDESFYFSNMAAQYHSLNAGDWKGVETLSRDLALVTGDVKVWAGNIGELKKIGTTSVPLQCWKIIYVKATGQWLAYLFNNDQSKPDGYNNNQVTKEFVEKLTGLKFNP